MPIYSFTCPKGHTREDFFARMEIPARMPCKQCRCKAAHDIGADHRGERPRFQTYFEPGLGIRVSSAREIDAFAEARGCVASGPNDRHFERRKITASERLKITRERLAKWRK